MDLTETPQSLLQHTLSQQSRFYVAAGVRCLPTEETVSCYRNRIQTFLGAAKTLVGLEWFFILMAWAGPAVSVLTLDLIQNMKKYEHFFIQ